jgi:hypothetical protein
MGQTRNPSSDGRGAFLGTGSILIDPIRSGDLTELLTELLAWRTQVEDFSYDPETGLILYEEEKNGLER